MVQFSGLRSWVCEIGSPGAEKSRRLVRWLAAATPDLFRPDRRIAAGAAGWRNDRRIARLRRWCANFRVNSCGRAEHAVGSRQFVAERVRLRGGRGALRRDGALLRHRLRRRATRRIPRGRWRGRLSRWRRRRRRSLRGCRAGCYQSCQDQKKRLSLHGEQMLPRHRCSILVEKTDWRIRSTGPQDSFSAVARVGQPFCLKRTSGDPGVMAGGAIHPSSACAGLSAAPSSD